MVDICLFRSNDEVSTKQAAAQLLFDLASRGLQTKQDLTTILFLFIFKNDTACGTSKHSQASAIKLQRWSPSVEAFYREANGRVSLLKSRSFKPKWPVLVGQNLRYRDVLLWPLPSWRPG